MNSILVTYLFFYNFVKSSNLFYASKGFSIYYKLLILNFLRILWLNKSGQSMRYSGSIVSMRYKTSFTSEDTLYGKVRSLPDLDMIKLFSYFIVMA